MKYPLKTAIVENEPDQLMKLKSLLDQRKDLFDVTLHVAEFGLASQLLKLQCFDLCIFDVALDEGKDCFDLVKEVGRDNIRVLAITTQFPNIPFNKAYDNIGKCLPFEKPYQKENLDKFIVKLNKEVLEIQNQQIYEIPLGSTKIPLQQNAICFLEGKGKHTLYYVVDRQTDGYKVIDSPEPLELAFERLSKDFFVQVHRSVIFNIHFYRGRSKGVLKKSEILNTRIRSSKKIRCSKKYLPALLKKLAIES